MKTELMVPFATAVLIALMVLGPLPHTLEARQQRLDPSRLHGRVQFVESFPDYRVQVVKSFPDLPVEMVNAFLDYRLKIVDSFPDFTIEYVEAFPGKQD